MVKPPLPGLLCLISAVAAGCAPAARTPTAGMLIDRGCRIAPGDYSLVSVHHDQPAIRITGESMTVDFSGVVLVGSRPGADPDSFSGLGVLVENGRDITIKNLRAHGYKVGLLARNVQRLRVIDCDLSYNYRPRLKSTLAREDTADWLSFHHNQKDEWLRYGAGIYLHGCDHAEVARCTITGGQNGLMITRCDEARIWNNTFNFNSGVGLGMYRSSRGTIMHNRLDWNVRGYSHGVYNRGQDSAAILIYEQSCGNTFAFNSATHSGDGFFLWAGQTTMDSGQGGCNDNVLYANDFSHAPCNGVEATFSRNTVIMNRIEDCWHGIWGGYSYETTIQGNRFGGNDIAIAIEHGQDNQIIANQFIDDRIGIRLWQNSTQDPNWGYPKHRDTHSRGYVIAGNTFSGVAVPEQITNTADIDRRLSPGIPIEPIPSLPGGIDAMLPSSHHRGRRFILVDEWGPYDFRSPRLWPREKRDDGSMRYELLGPPGRWVLVSSEGVGSISAREGPVPGELIVQPDRATPLRIEMEYVGGEVVSQFGAIVPAGNPYRFSASN